MTAGTGIPVSRYARATQLKKAIDRSPVNPSPPEAGVFAWTRPMADSAAHAERAISLLKCRQIGHWPNHV
jgi:hypothetical protein